MDDPIIVPPGGWEVRLDYFKMTGKWKYDGTYYSHCEALHQIWTEVRQMSAAKELPGLQSGSWDEGPISVDVPEHPHSHPHLVMP